MSELYEMLGKQFHNHRKVAQANCLSLDSLSMDYEVGNCDICQGVLFESDLIKEGLGVKFHEECWELDKFNPASPYFKDPSAEDTDMAVIEDLISGN